ncbi:ABC transporter substrate-binding protein [Spelaeicoccus albus]|uniref:Raffinose/stachyose/melibiose transport system substrate-binding protein n=1 Tax=Spelaeicoccus albus TaxID=1280376 RepID=A0A7Z0A9E4_9MICO|nr:extracellular solute-binding protein [Spelaeicoccus albus]NYI66832.1 raffinose/stachyose/melibiose transport system substrate-binding protein [Spelaeicoccus albus]
MKLRKTHTLIAVAAAAALTFGAAGCGSSGPGDTSSGSPASMWGLTGGDQPILQNSVDAWNKKHPDQKINVNFFANDAYKTKVRTAVGAGKGPSFIYGWGGGVLKSYVDSDQVMDLTDFLKKNPQVKKRYIPSVLKNGQSNGTTYALPNNKIQPVMLFYNKELFKKIGAEPPTTWDDLMALVPKFKKAGIAPLALGGQSKWPDLMWLEYLADRIGGPQVFKDIKDNKPGAWSDPAIIESLTKIQKLVKAGGFAEGFSSVAADSNADQALLYTGKAAMILQGNWIYQSMKTDAPKFLKAGKLGYTTFPSVSGGKGNAKNIVGNPSNFWSISSKASTEQKQTAKDYLKSALFDKSYVKDVIKSGAVPPVTGIEKQIAASDDSKFLMTAYSMAKNAPNFQLSWDQALSPKQGQKMLTQLDQIFLRKVTPKQFARAMNETIKK